MTADPLYAPLRPEHAPEWLTFPAKRAFADIIAASAIRPREFHETSVAVAAAMLANWRRGHREQGWLLVLARMLADCGVPRGERRRLLIPTSVQRR